VGITLDEASFLLVGDIERARQALYQKLPWTLRISDARRGALVNMAFNMGIDKLMDFKKTLAHMEAGRWFEASQEMLASTWAKQVGDRAVRLSDQVRLDEWK
jgi:lysozyme